MGAYLSEPITEAISNDDHSKRFSYGASSMQGWRNSQEDAHNCILNFDKDASFFAVYDGHGGAEVAQYCSTQFPDFLKTMGTYQAENLSQALEDAFLNFDSTLTTPEVKAVLKSLSDSGRLSSDAEDETDVKELRSEANMPIKDLLAKYSGAFGGSKSSPVLGGPDDVTSDQKPQNGSVNDQNSSANSSVEESTSNDDIEKLSKTSNKTLVENGIDKHSEGLNKDIDTVDGPNMKISDAVEMGTSRQGSSSNEVAGSSADASKNKSNNLNLNNRKRDLRPKEQVMLLDSSDDDSDVSDEEYDGANESGHGSSDEDSKEEDDDDQWEDIEDEAEPGELPDMEEPGMDSGCTAVVAVVKGSMLYVANAGDSRCIVCRNSIAVEMSCDHKPEDEIETKRIVAAGGQVTAEGRVNGGLNLSRAIGDHRYKQNESLPAKEQMISAQPDIQTLSIDPKNDEFMVLACDGIWNMMTSQQVVDFVKKRIETAESLSSICEELFMHCLAPDTSGDGTGCDNMTAIIVTFQPRKPSNNESSKAGNKRSASDEDKPDVKKTKTE